MKITNRFRSNVNGRFLAIFETKRGDLICEVYSHGVRRVGQWDSRARFDAWAKDCSVYRVREYFGFNRPSAVEVF